MSEFDVYPYEMAQRKFADEDVERLLSGGTPEDEGLARLAPIIERLKSAQTSISPNESQVEAFAVEAAAIAQSTAPEKVVVAAAGTISIRSRRFTSTLTRKMATALTAVLLLAGMTGVAVAADGAAPGDALYGLDRAFESVGINNGAAAERIAEAQALYAKGKTSEAVAHAAEAAGQVGNDTEEAADALLRAADQLRGNEQGSEHAIEVRSRVAAMLDYMATTDDTGSHFGQGVAALARGISGEGDAAGRAADEAEKAAKKAEGHPGPPDGVPAGPPEGVNPGPPDS